MMQLGRSAVVPLMLLNLVAGAVAPGFAGPRPAQLVRQTSVTGGVIVQLGCGESEDIAALRVSDAFIVHALDADEHSVARARADLQRLGVNGPVSVGWFDGRRMPYIDNLVNLLIIRRRFELSDDEIQRVLVPGGVAVTVDQQGTISHRSEKAWPKSIDQWTHALHAGDNNPVAADSIVGPPKHLQWICDPKWSKHHERYPPTIPVVVSAKGRMIYLEDTSPPSVFNVAASWSLVARDAFNGVVLWKRAAPRWEPMSWPGNLGGGLSGGPIDYRRRLVAVGDRVFVTLGYLGPVMALDATNGKNVSTFEGTGGEATEIVVHDDALVVSQRKDRASPYEILRFDRRDGTRLWSARGGVGMAVDDGRVLLIDGNQIVARDLETGRQLWRSEAVVSGGTANKGRSARRSRGKLQGPLRTGAGVVLACPGARGAVVAFAVTDGRRLWTRQNAGFRPFFRPVTAWIIDDLVWMIESGIPEGDVADDYVAVGVDPLTGEVRRRVPCGAVWNCGHHQRCYPSKATTNYLIFSRRGAEFLNLKNADVTLNNWTRGTCGYGVMPANGLMYAPPHSCRCYSEAALRGLCAFAANQRRITPDKLASAGKQLNRESAPAPKWDAEETRPPSPDDWPTYRHDLQRSGASTSKIGSSLQPVWQIDFGGRVAQPVSAAGRLYVVQPDAHLLTALELASGRKVWEFTAGGRIDTPPTVWRGRLVFGSADGTVYCLRARDGRPVWRFRAAPIDLRMGANGQLESVWPVHGSVLVQQGTAYFAAGRASFVDQGIWIYGVDVETGQLQYRRQYLGPDTGAGLTRDHPGRGFVMPGGLPDILVGDGQNVFMRHLVFDTTLNTVVNVNPNYYPAPRRSGEEFGGDHKYWCDLLEVGPRAFVGHPDWDYRSYFNNFPGQRLYSTTGLLDDSWHIRSYWAYGQVVGQYLVFQGDVGYAALAYPNAARWASYQAGQGYLLYAGHTVKPQPGERIYALKREQRDWQVRIPLRPIAMAVAGDKLVVAGPPDKSDPQAAAAALAGQLGGQLRLISRADGTTIADWPLDAPPVYDGVITAAGRLILALRNGRLVCYQ